MLFRLHYWLITSGACALNVLMGVYMQHYTDASHWEIGLLFMIMPFITMMAKPIVCSKADRETAHRRYLQNCLCLVALSYLAFIVIPFFGPSIYEAHPRYCWYSLVVLKIIGDSAFACAWTLGDALAINYSRRVGEEFCTYRVWGTISWMAFGLLIGSINEVQFLPKYVPAFMVLILSCILNVFVVWLWPAEYFRMVRVSDEESMRREEDKSRRGILMPRPLVFSHMRSKLMAFLSCNCMSSKVKYVHDHWTEPEAAVAVAPSEASCHKQSIDESNKQMISIINKFNGSDDNRKQILDDNNNEQQHHHNNLILSATGKQAMAGFLNPGGRNNKSRSKKQLNGSSFDSQMIPHQLSKQDSIELQASNFVACEDNSVIGKRLQLQILWLLAKRNPSFFGYIIIFALIGLGQVGLFFFFMDMENVCATRGTCHFSQLAGLVQVTMASSETLLFFYIKAVKKYLSHDDMCALAFLCNGIKWLFYGFFWREVDPRWVLLVECLHGLNFGFYLTLVVEIAHLFAGQVNNLVPDLYKRGMVSEKMDREKLRMSLSATMQAIMSSCTDGLGRGVGALICGFIIETYSYRVLWLILGTKSALAFLVVMIMNIYCRIQNAREPKAQSELKQESDRKLENCS